MPVKIFFCYAHEDELLLKQLKRHLIPLQRQGLIDMWYDRDISAGTEWEQEISKRLKEAHIILLLISPDFMYSDYSYGIEMKRALERHAKKEVTVIPIILRPIYWEGILGNIQALPTDAIPVTDPLWHNLDRAFFNIAEGIRMVVQKLLARNDAEQWIRDGDKHYYQKYYIEAMAAYEKALYLDPDYTLAYNGKGMALTGLKRYEEALDAYEKALCLDPNNVSHIRQIADTLLLLKRYREALSAYIQVIQLKSIAAAWYNKGLVLVMLGNFQDAADAYRCAFQLDPGLLIFHIFREGIIHLLELGQYEQIFATISLTINLLIVPSLELSSNLTLIHIFEAARLFLIQQRKEEALAVCEQALNKLELHSILDYFAKASLLFLSERKEEALVVCEEAIKLVSNPILAYLTKALLLFLTAREKESLVVCKQALDKLELHSILDYPTKALLLFMLERKEEALAVCEQALDKPELHSVLDYLTKALLLFMLERKEEALVVCEVVLDKLNLDPALAYLTKALLLFMLERKEEALAICEEALRSDPDFILAYIFKVAILSDLERKEEALVSMDQIIQLVPNSGLAYIWKGELLRDLERREEELEAYDQAIRLNPNDALIYNSYVYKNIGNALYSLNQFSEALAAYEQALLLNPDYALVYNNKGVVLERLNRKEEAQQAYDKVRQLGYISQVI